MLSTAPTAIKHKHREARKSLVISFKPHAVTEYSYLILITATYVEIKPRGYCKIPCSQP